MHIDQLKEWWENADQVAPMRGDLVIEDVTDEYGTDYRIRNWPGDMKKKLSHVRVLEPKPNPAWHNAPAVIATGDAGDGDLFTGVWIPHGSPERWECADVGIILGSEQLHDVTPLIEAMVTDKMIDRILDVIDARFDNYPAGIGEDLAVAALGLETE